ncbi:MAG TPA: YlbF family regulator [Halanaerobiales bacterium]|nr:YlbF family regulator [Halanaerobiales bacterium]
MAVYDLAHRLATKVKESTEYQEYLQIRKSILNNEKNRDMLLDFRKEQFKIQAKQISGQEVSEEDKEKLNNLRQIIELNPDIKKYLETEYRVGVLLDDLQKIVFGELEIGLPDASEDKDGEE